MVQTLALPDAPTVAPETPGDASGVEAVVAAAFGPGRFAKTAERLREGSRPIAGLVARQGDRVVASVRLWPVTIGGTRAAFLGPIAVDQGLRKSGVGAELVERCHAAAASLGLAAVLLVGDTPYFGRFGYARADVEMPGPVDPRRVLVKVLGAGPAPAGAVVGC